MTSAIQSLVLNPLHPLLSPVTHNLPRPVADFAISLLGPQCYTALLHDLDIVTRPECLPLAISKALGIAIIGASCIVKVPQLLKLVRSQSAEGLSFTSYALETASFLITLAYNIRNGFPFSTYGETVFILLQDVAIAALILVYSSRTAQGGAFIAAVVAVAYALLLDTSGLVSNAQMTQLQGVASLLGIASKVPQIYTIYAQGGTGQLSSFAVFNYLLGSLARVFTTYQEVNDKLILGGFVVGFLLNAVLAGQMVWYWNSPSTGGHGNELKEKGRVRGIGQSGKQGIETEEKRISEGRQGVQKVVTPAAQKSSPSTRRRG